MFPIPHHTLTLRSFLLYAGACICGTLFVIYTLFQARFLIAGPQIALATQDIVSNERLVSIDGSAENIVRMTLNGRQIFTDADGNFSEALVLENGYTIATLEALDRYGRITRQTQTFVYVPNDTEVVINQ